MKPKYIIGSGWWCSKPEEDARDQKIGDDFIRSDGFHSHWYQSVVNNSNPQKIIIVDSNSDIPPPINSDDARIEYLKLNVNAGHSTNHRGKYCGCLRAMLVGIEYAAACDSDYYVYVEQDALLSGPGIIEHCISKMTTPYMFGAGLGTSQPIQQSLFIIRRDGFEPFTQAIKSIDATDYLISPEEKFVIATMPRFRWLAIRLALAPHSNRLVRRLSKMFLRKMKKVLYKKCKGYDELPVGYGRVRPMNLNDRYFYFQHGSIAELQEYQRKELV